MSGVGGFIEQVALDRQRERECKRAEHRAGDANAEQYEFAAVAGNPKCFSANVADAFERVDPWKISDLWVIAGVDDGCWPIVAIDVHRGAGVEHWEDRRCAVAVQDGPIKPLMAASTLGVT